MASMKRLIILALIATLGFSSCVKKEDIKFVSFDGFNMPTMSLVELTFTMENSSRSNVGITDAKLSVGKSGHEILQLLLDDVVTVPKQFNGQVVVPLRVRLTDMFGALALSRELQSGDFNALSASGEIIVKVGAIKKKIDIDDVPLADVIRGLGANLDNLSLPL